MRGHRVRVGYEYRFNGETHLSLDPVVGARRVAVKLADSVVVRAVKRHVAVVGGEKVSMGALVASGMARVLKRERH